MKIVLYQFQREIHTDASREGPRFKVLSERLSQEIDIIISIPTVTELDNAYLDSLNN